MGRCLSKIMDPMVNHQPKMRIQPQKFVSSLTGMEMNSEDFTHNNMAPFFGGSVKQNTFDTANNTLLEPHTGVQQYSIPKEEKKPFFEPSKEMSYVFGTPN